MNRPHILHTTWQDARHAMRALRKNPAFTATAVLTLALAIGGNTAMFTVIRAVLLNPLAYPEPDRLVRMSGGATPTRFDEMKATAHSFSGLGAFTSQENIALAGDGEPEVLKGSRVSAGFLRILGADPVLGREFRPEEDSPGGVPVAMISTELWQRRFAGDPQIVGKVVSLAAAPSTIIGVLPPRFQFPFPGLDVWMTAPAESPLFPGKSRALSPFLSVFGRLRSGVSLEQANAELKVIHHRYAMAHPAMLDSKPRSPEVTPMKEQLVAGVRATLWLLFGSVGFVLLIACANVAGLLLARAGSRSREFAVRAALGAGRLRLIGQLLVESVLLSFAGGALGVLLAWFCLRAIPHLTSFDLPRTSEIHLDWIVLAFAAVVSMATGILFGLAPSLGASRPDLIAVLRASGEGANRSAPRGILPRISLRSLLSVGQIGLSVVLLIGASLLMESIAYLRGVRLGFNPSNLLTMRITLPLLRYDTDHKTNAFFQELIRRVETLPGVHGAAAAMTLPMMAYPGTPVQDAAKPPLKLNERPIAKIFLVTPGYFHTLEIPLRRGREFTEQDMESTQAVAMIDENLARHFWPAYPAGLDPVGQRIFIGGTNPKPVEIVGIVADVHQILEDATWPDSVYVPGPPATAVFAVRTDGDPLSYTSAVREQVQALDPHQPIAAVETMEELVEAELGERRLLMTLLACFAGVALLLAVIGIYGVIAYSVVQRTQELGIRRALGAQHGDILWLVMGQGLLLALSGIAAGLAGAFALTRVMTSVLFHVSPVDPVTFAAVALLFLVVALLATYIPARRAARIDPMAALRV